MVSALERRVERLEETFGNSPCLRCNNTQIIIGLSGEITVIKDKVRFAPQAAEQFYLEERPDSVCPVCGRQRQRVHVTWPNLS